MGTGADARTAGLLPIRPNRLRRRQSARLVIVTAFTQRLHQLP
jgi:hypothetical protein